MSPAPRTVVARDSANASHSWTEVRARAPRQPQASHSWTYLEPRPAEQTDLARAAA